MSGTGIGGSSGAARDGVEMVGSSCLGGRGFSDGGAFWSLCLPRPRLRGQGSRDIEFGGTVSRHCPGWILQVVTRTLFTEILSGWSQPRIRTVKPSIEFLDDFTRSAVSPNHWRAPNQASEKRPLTRAGGPCLEAWREWSSDSAGRARLLPACLTRLARSINNRFGVGALGQASSLLLCLDFWFFFFLVSHKKLTDSFSTQQFRPRQTTPQLDGSQSQGSEPAKTMCAKPTSLFAARQWRLTGRHSGRHRLQRP